jgi:hypothetical protein
MAEVEKPANIPIRARAAKNCHTLLDKPMAAVKIAIAQLERSKDSLRPRLSAIRPQIGEANAATNDVDPVMMPLQISMPCTEETPRPGSMSGTIGLRKPNEPVIRNWMPTMAQSVRRHPVASGAMISRDSSICRHRSGSTRDGKV